MTPGPWYLPGQVLLVPAVLGRSKRAAFIADAVLGPAFFVPLIAWLANLGILLWLGLTAGQALILGLAAMPLPRLLTLPDRPLFSVAWATVGGATRVSGRRGVVLRSSRPSWISRTEPRSAVPGEAPDDRTDDRASAAAASAFRTPVPEDGA